MTKPTVSCAPAVLGIGEARGAGSPNRGKFGGKLVEFKEVMVEPDVFRYTVTVEVSGHTADATTFVRGAALDRRTLEGAGGSKGSPAFRFAQDRQPGMMTSETRRSNHGRS